MSTRVGEAVVAEMMVVVLNVAAVGDSEVFVEDTGARDGSGEAGGEGGYDAERGDNVVETAVAVVVHTLQVDWHRSERLN